MRELRRLLLRANHPTVCTNGAQVSAPAELTRLCDALRRPPHTADGSASGGRADRRQAGRQTGRYGRDDGRRGRRREREGGGGRSADRGDATDATDTADGADRADGAGGADGADGAEVSVGRLAARALEAGRVAAYDRARLAASLQCAEAAADCLREELVGCETAQLTLSQLVKSLQASLDRTTRRLREAEASSLALERAAATAQVARAEAAT